jgi:hypothetical protein
MKAGDTFFLWDKAADIHLWVVFTDPELHPDLVLIVSLTTYTVDQENVCIINAGEHPWVRHKTCVAYGRTTKTSMRSLCELRDSGKIIINIPVSQEIVDRIRLGASKSRKIAREFIEIMGDQDLLD